jgi:hypothetical protein
MRIHHRIPSIFNLSMVDVLCCALGCVILLWLLNLRVARDRTLQASETFEQLGATQIERDKWKKQEEEDQTRLSSQDQFIATLWSEWKNAEDRSDELKAKLRLEEDEAKATARRLSDVTEKLRNAEERGKTLAAVADKVPELVADAKKRDKELSESALALADARKQMKTLSITKSDLEKDLDSREKALDEMRAKLKEQEKEADVAKSLVAKRDKSLLTTEQMLKDREKTLEETKVKLALLQQESDARDKDLASATRVLDTLRDEQKKLTTRVEKLQAASENRFEGIALTGRRVIFLVDMSGSMELVDENTPAPLKWTGVRESVARIMKSLPDLEKFQIIVFSDKPTFLFGENEGWHKFEGKDSINRVTRALANIKPKGGTNMYAAMNAAFRYRADGLDTIYLLSDGLPNLGEGATAEQERNLKETELGEILGKHIRKKLKSDWNKVAKDNSRVRINAVGFFYESPDVGAFLWALARENEGSFVGMSKP